MSLEKIKELHSELAPVLRKLEQYKVSNPSRKTDLVDLVGLLVDLEHVRQIESKLTSIRFTMLAEALQEKGISVDLGIVRIEDLLKVDLH